ncbi:amino acid permease [Bacillus sp. BR_7a]|uniref:amino acid permease n=1 Tax=Bacillus sp. BR_7a TaxID=3055775 RepID=UPI00365748D3
MTKQSLERSLKARHIHLIAIGGTIGTGIFMGSSDTISLAGPAVIFTYILAGLLLLVVMGALAEMATAFPNVSMHSLIRMAFGKRISFIVSWLYWINWTLVTIVEVLAAGSFLRFWFTTIPLWVLSLLVACVLIGINLINVKYFGEIEFGFASIKIITLIIFIILGSCFIFGIFSNDSSTSVMNLTNNGGIFPKGINSVFSALLIVIFSYGGSELIGVTLTEMKDVRSVLPGVIKGLIFRIVLFYALPIIIICALIPWNQIAGHGSPFVHFFSLLGLNSAAHIMNFVLLTAVISAANSGLYATSRLLFSLAQDNEAPKALSKLNKNGIPFYAVITCGLCLFIGSLLAYITPDKVISYLMSVPGVTILLLWMSICLAQVKLRKSYKIEPAFKLWLFPYITLFACLCLSGTFIMFLLNPSNRINSLVSLSFVAFVSVCSLIKHKNNQELKHNISTIDSSKKRIQNESPQLLK